MERLFGLKSSSLNQNVQTAITFVQIKKQFEILTESESSSFETYQEVGLDMIAADTKGQLSHC